MYISCVGLDYNTADVELRGKVAFTESRYLEVYNRMKNITGILGIIILSTCNRTEIYVHSKDTHKDDSVIKVLKEFFNLQEENLESFFNLDTEKSIKHIFRVASGMESMVLGEDQILMQVKVAQKRAIDNNFADSILNKVFREAITCAKEIKHRTSISQNKLSLASIAVDIITKHYEKLSNKAVLVLGVGEMSQLAIRGLIDKGVNKIYLANRTLYNSNNIKEEFKDLIIIDYDKRYEVLQKVDIVVSSTSAPHLIFCYDEFKEKFNNKELLLVDMAVPRDIDSKINNIDNITMYNIDSFKSIAEENIHLRNKLTIEAQSIIEKYEDSLNVWLENRDVHSLLSRIDIYVEDTVNCQAEALMYKLECEDNMNKEEAKEFALNLSNKLLKKLALKVKKAPKEQVGVFIDVLNQLLEV